jgi:hypothetical protein
MNLTNSFKTLTILSLTAVFFTACQSGQQENSETMSEEATAAETSGEEWTMLFNGEDFSGWHEEDGDPNFYIEDETIIGITEEGLPNTFLVTDKTYDDFVLELDFKIDSSINSGVQIRSTSYEEDTTTPHLTGQLEEVTRDWEAGKFYGYQVEIDPSDRAWTGGFYEEGGRGWLQPVTENEEGRKAFKPGEWNHMRIEAEGDHFQTYVNGVKVSDYRDDSASSGHIGLQLHGAWREEQIGQQVMYKNIKLREL